MAQQLTDDDFARAAAALGTDGATIRAVAEVEASGHAFLPDGRPTALYEAHVFHRNTGGKFASARDRRGVKLSSPSWDRTLYGAAGAAQHDRIGDAAKLDWDAAHKAASWGLFQVLGESHRACDHDTVRSFVNAMHEGAGRHLDAFVAFVKNNRLDAALRQHDWARFARGYNGPGYAQNAYDTKLAAAYRKWTTATA